ncbi:TetR/AcrR family transcriptional regulator [Nocardioides sp.]|uniref:TetR/AcrR family transcriptional regulator n=1 Tax=Nocardioides sp. TaxID=35761 RepID=UPI00261AFA19|nr:TetR/AcrR family transcriptional regulator [Nocardioides sp.]
MSDARAKVTHGDAETRRRITLEAASALLDEGGYTALTMRAVAERAGMSVGLIYQYFADKSDIFITLLTESQVEARESLAALPREQGLTELLRALIPEAARQWRRVGRFTATWRDSGGRLAERESIRDVRRTADAYNADLVAALHQAAAAEGAELIDDPAVLPYVLSSIQGLADTMVHQWARDLDDSRLIDFTATAVARAIGRKSERG